MIASLTGKVQRTSLGLVVIDVSGVGYLVNVSPATAAGLNPGVTLTLHTAYIVREDAHTIFGFESLEELEVFDLLRSVNGVGPKSALAIVASVGVARVSEAVANDDDAVFRSVSGIGPKTAKLITVTLAGKLTANKNSVDADLLAALIGLGYKDLQAKEALRKASGASQQERLRSALSVLSGANK